MITAITCSMLDSPSTSDDDEMKTDVSKSTRLKPTKILMKEARIFCRASRSLVSRGHNIGVKINLMEILH